MRRKRRLERLAVQIGKRAREAKRQALCDQNMALDAVFSVERFAAVFFVSRQRMADISHMGADLVRFSAVDADLRQRIFAAGGLYAVIGGDLVRTRARRPVYAYARGALVLYEIRGERTAFFFEGKEADRLVYLFGTAFAESREQFSFRRGVQGENDQPRGVAVQTVDKTGAPLLCKGGGKRLGIHAREFIRDENIFVFVNDRIEGAGFLFGRRVITDLVSRRKVDIFTRLFSVDADVAVAKKA